MQDDRLCWIDFTHGIAVARVFITHDEWLNVREASVKRAAEIVRDGLMQDGAKGVCAACAFYQQSMGGVRVIATRTVSTRGKPGEWKGPQ